MMKKLFLTILLATTLGQAHAITNNHNQAKSLNSQGYSLYKQGKFAQALPVFYKATQVDKNYMLGHYNFACTASIVLEKSNCSLDEKLTASAEPKNILSALKTTLELRPQRMSRIQTDPDLALARKSYGYYHDVLGYSVNNEKQLTLMLQGIDWQSKGSYLYHTEPEARLDFRKNGQIQVTKATLRKDEKPENAPPWTYNYKSGSYTVNKDTVTLVFENTIYGTQKIVGKLSEEGILTFEGASKANILPKDEYHFIWTTPCKA